MMIPSCRSGRGPGPIRELVLRVTVEGRVPVPQTQIWRSLPGTVPSLGLQEEGVGRAWPVHLTSEIQEFGSVFP